MSKRIVLIFTIVFLTYLQVYSEGLFSEPEIGFYGAYGLSFQAANFQKLPGVSSCCPNYSGGFGSAFSLGPLLKFNISPNVFLDTRIQHRFHACQVNQSVQFYILC